MGFIDNIISVVVNIVESFVDLVIDVVEVVLEAAASLLGYEDQIIEQFEVYLKTPKTTPYSKLSITPF